MFQSGRGIHYQSHHLINQPIGTMLIIPYPEGVYLVTTMVSDISDDSGNIGKSFGMVANPAMP